MVRRPYSLTFPVRAFAGRYDCQSGRHWIDSCPYHYQHCRSPAWPDPPHIDENRAARMVDVGGAAVTERVAVASAVISMPPATLAPRWSRAVQKGDAGSRPGGYPGREKCSDLIPRAIP